MGRQVRSAKSWRGWREPLLTGWCKWVMEAKASGVTSLPRPPLPATCVSGAVSVKGQSSKRGVWGSLSLRSSLCCPQRPAGPGGAEGGAQPFCLSRRGPNPHSTHRWPSGLRERWFSKVLFGAAPKLLQPIIPGNATAVREEDKRGCNSWCELPSNQQWNRPR